jgi:S-adenosylmethionine hydrolase
MTGIITLLTDFGTADGYVGAMKGSILSMAPGVTIVDISHQVPPQDVRFGAFTLMTATDTFPSGSVHVGVVDPGVGGARRAVAIRIDGSYFVGPDNGLLSWVVAGRLGGITVSEALELGPDATAVSLDVASYWRPSVSSTFHGRDIFGPVAAHLSRGETLDRLGKPITTIAALPFPIPVERNGALVGEILVVDHFGNCITNMRGNALTGRPAFEIAGRTIASSSANYESSEELVALIGSSGFLEIAVPNGSAAGRLGVAPGATVVARPSSQSSLPTLRGASPGLH